MRLLRNVLAPVIASSLLAASVAGASAQEASPDQTISPDPAPLEVEGQAVPLPVADYWVEWLGHKQASHERASRTIRDATRSRSGTAKWYQALVGIHRDELRWLANHQPLACYQGEYEQWTSAVQDLHAIHQKALRFVRTDNAAGLRRTEKQRRATMKRLNGALANVAACVPQEQDPADSTTSNPLVGKWNTVQRFVNEDGVNATHNATTKIARDGRFLLRVKRDDFCRQRGIGLRPLTLSGQGEFLTDDSPQLTWAGAKLHCYPRGGGRKLVLESGPPDVPWRYDDTYDVLLGVQGPGNCSWRAKTGSPKDCKAYWRGTPLPTEDAQASLDEAASPDVGATAPPDESEG